MARPSRYSKRIVDELCARIAVGKSLREICAGKDMPAMRTVYRWLSSDGDQYEAFRQQYARARKLQADTYADEIVYIADQAKTGDEARVAREQIEARKWTAGKLQPQKYCWDNRIERVGADGGAIRYEVLTGFVRGPGERRSADD